MVPPGHDSYRENLAHTIKGNELAVFEQSKTKKRKRFSSSPLSVVPPGHDSYRENLAHTIKGNELLVFEQSQGND